MHLKINNNNNNNNKHNIVYIIYKYIHIIQTILIIVNMLMLYYENKITRYIIIKYPLII